MRLFLLYFITIVWLWGDITILSTQKIADRWQIHYLTSSLETNKTTLEYNSANINHTILYPQNKLLASAGIFLIDTSVPMKKAFRKGIKPTIKEIFKLKNSWDRWAIASFDSEMKIIGEYNQTTPNNALDNITIGGSRTELYRASLQAIESLKSQNAIRKFLFLFSDGEAEDNAYTYQEVIAKAIESNVTIISFGYKDSIHLQSLRRISEESIGGKLYIAHKSKHLLPQGDITDFNNSIHNDKILNFDANLLQSNENGSVELILKIDTDNNSSISQIVRVAVDKLTPIVNIEQIPIVKSNNILYYAIGTIILIILILIWLFRNKKADNIEEDIIISTPKPIAYLLSTSGSKKYIYKIHNSIGALSSNDIVIDGEFISRHHATLDFKDGSYFLIDNNSANGLYVNYEKISNQKIEDGDILSFGPYEVTFKI